MKTKYQGFGEGERGVKNPDNSTALQLYTQSQHTTLVRKSCYYGWCWAKIFFMQDSALYTAPLVLEATSTLQMYCLVT